MYNPTCKCCSLPCSWCKDSKAPVVVKATVEGIVNGTCEDCDQLNGEYYLEPLGESFPCHYVLNFDAICSVGVIEVIFGNTEIFGTMHQSGFGFQTQFNKEIPFEDRPYDCMDQHVLTNYLDLLFECNFSGATITVEPA